MVKFKVPLKDILQNAYFEYELTSSNYNPLIDTTITITCTCKNVLGNPIADKELELYQNGTSQGSATTNANGIATWTLTMSNWGTQDIQVENQTISVNVTGFKSKSMWNGTLYYDNEKVQYVLNQTGSGTYNASTWTDSGAFDVVPSSLRPQRPIYSTIGNTRMTVRVNPDTGKVQYTTGGASVSNPYIQCVLLWLLP